MYNLLSLSENNVSSSSKPEICIHLPQSYANIYGTDEDVIVRIIAYLELIISNALHFKMSKKVKVQMLKYLLVYM